TSATHGSPLGLEEVALTKKALGWEWETPFTVPEEVREHLRAAIGNGEKKQAAWDRTFESYEKEFPDLAKEWRQALAGELPEHWDTDLPSWKAGEKEATRSAAGAAENVIAARVPWLFGGDADLSSSTRTTIERSGSFEGRHGAGRNVHFGVREHAMAGIANGIAYHGGLRPFAATFFCFSDYMRPSVRLSALNELPLIYVWTHDSIGLGEDGPTHQPVEHLMSLRAMPGMTIIRPADANEAAEAWRAAMNQRQGPVGLVLTRQKVPVIDRGKYASARGLAKGAYVLAEAGGGTPRVILIATGSEVAVALEARETLEHGGVPTRVVSMPSWELFEKQPRKYREEVLPPTIRARLSIEAGATLGWTKHVGDEGDSIGLDRYGASAPGETAMTKLGFSTRNVVKHAKALLKRRT
ncbi:MAG: transketolase-like TK C-terminal-containing protein, partial [Candidatus Rokuibacteriota bacterium]